MLSSKPLSFTLIIVLFCSGSTVAAYSSPLTLAAISSGTEVPHAQTPWHAIPNPLERWHVQDEPTSAPSTLKLQSTITQNSETDSIQFLLDEALLRSPRAASIRANLGIARAQYAYQLMQPNPMLFFDRGILAEAVRRIGPAFNWVSPWQIVFGLLLARDQVAQAKIDIWRDLWTLRADVQRAYSDVIIAQETETATVALLELAKKTEDVTAKRFQAGAVPGFDVVRARLAREQAEVDLVQAQRRVLKAKQHLNLLVGRPLDRKLAIAPLESVERRSTESLHDDFFPNLARAVPEITVFINHARRFRWDIKDIDQQIKVNKAALHNAYSDAVPMPQFYMGQSVSGNQPSGPKLTATFLTLMQPLPITNLNQGDVEKFKATGKQLHWQRSAVMNQAEIEVSSAYQDLMTFRDRIKLYKEHVLADALQSARMARRSYEVGQGDITAALQAQQANFQIQLQYVADLQSYQQAYIALEQAVGIPLQ